MPYALIKKLHPPPSPSSLHILGEAAVRSRRFRFGLLSPDRLRHLYIIGKTGTGKSTLLSHCIAQDLAAGAGLAVLDPHGDLVDAALQATPRWRTNEVCLIDPSDTALPVSFNVFRRGRSPAPDPALVAAAILSVFKKQWGDSWGPRLEHVLRNGLLAVAEDPRGSLMLLYRFLTDPSFREKRAERIRDPVVAAFWRREFPSYKAALQAEALAPVLNKLGAFVGNPLVRRLIGQTRSRLDVGALLESGGVLLARLSTGRIGEDAAHLLGGLLLSSLQLAAMSRTNRRPFYLYVDEFQNFVTDSLGTMLAEARKFGLGLILAHQYLGQLPVSLQGAVLGNAGSLLTFRLGPADAELLAPTFAPALTALDLLGLGAHRMAVRLLARGVTLDPFIATALPPRPVPSDGAAVAEQIRAQSRHRFGRLAEDVDADIVRVIGVSPPTSDSLPTRGSHRPGPRSR